MARVRPEGHRQETDLFPGLFHSYMERARPLVWIIPLLLLLESCHSHGGKLQSVRAIRSLPAACLQEAPEVDLQGIVTLRDDRSRLLVIQDGSGAIAVESRHPFPGLNLGDRVQVQGFAGRESHAPVVVKPRIKRLGAGALPEAHRVDATPVFEGQVDCQRVELECRVTERSQEEADRFELKAELGGKSFTVLGNFVLPQGLFFDLVGRRICLRGIPMTARQPWGDFHALTFHVASLDDFQDLSGVPYRLGPTSPVSSLRGGPGSGPKSGGAHPGAISGAWPVLTTIQAVKALSPREAEQGHPVHIRGIVTAFESDRNQLWVQDSTAGISLVVPGDFVKPKSGVRPGIGVEIGGTTMEGAPGPGIQIGFLRMGTPGTWPQPIEVHPERGYSALEESRWAQVQGVITRVDPDRASNRIQMELQSGGIRIALTCPLTSSEMGRAGTLVDRAVKARGVYVPLLGSDLRLLGFSLKSPSLAEVEALSEPLGDTFDAQPRPIHGLMEYSADGMPRHRVKVAGQVTHVGEDRRIYLQDSSAGIGLELLEDADIRVGDCLEALGFLDAPIWGRGCLKNVVLRPVKYGAEIKPQSIAMDGAITGIHDRKLVTVTGFLRDQSVNAGDRILFLESGRTRFTAVLEHPRAFPKLERLRAGALLQLTGVCEVQWDGQPPMPASISIRLRSPDDIGVIHGAPFWTVHRALALMGVLLLALLGATAYLTVLQRRVKTRTRELETQMREREALEEELHQTQKLEGVGRLAGGVAHDFNNLLTVINGYSEILLSELAGQKALVDCAEQIQVAGERAASLTRQLLAFSRKQVLQPSVLDLNRLMAEMDGTLRGTLGKDVELLVQAATRPCLMKADPNQITQVVLNLVANSCDAMPQGGQIRIEASLVQLGESEVRGHQDVAPGHYVRLSVLDTGIGMDGATLSRIFEPFFTTKELGKGTGLGLSAVFGIVKQSGGHIWVESHPGQGTEFKLFFPAMDEDVAREFRKTNSDGSGERTVLVVEDQPEVLKLVCRTLEGRGYRILTASDGAEALRVSDEHSGEIDVLLTDIVMPGMNGRDLARQMGEQRPGMKVLFMSGYAEGVVIHRADAKDDKGLEFIQKPFASRELTARIARLLGEIEPRA